MSFHLFHIRELYSSADGRVQFVEFIGDADGQQFWSGHALTSTSGATTRSFTFPTNLANGLTAGKSVLVATQGFADLGLVTPDFIVPDRFLFPAGGTVAVAGMDSVAHGALPTGGTQSVDDNGLVGTNSPTNFAGDTAAIPGNPVVGTAGVDFLVGTSAADFIVGIGGDDTLLGDAGNDSLNGGAGRDRLDGGAGTDSMVGGAGGDVYVVDSVGDLTIESGTLAIEFDVVLSAVSRTLGPNLEQLDLSGTSPISGAGNGLANRIVGNTAANTLTGNGGADTLNGGGGGDTLGGGTGNDTLAGGAGNDLLIGGSGDDWMAGGSGNDTYVVGTSGDRVFETGTAATEIDRVQASVSATLGANVEQLTLAGGTTALRGTGNALANAIGGNAGNNALDGGAGDDTLNGGAGNDGLTGGTGADDFRFSTALSATANVDRLTDFAPADDRISLDDAIFTAIGPVGALDAAAFHAGTAAADADDRIVYDSATGRLYYDADGTGAGAAILFATVAPGTTITAADFFVI